MFNRGRVKDGETARQNPQRAQAEGVAAREREGGPHVTNDPRAGTQHLNRLDHFYTNPDALTPS